MARVTLFSHLCANIFTVLRGVSFGEPLVFQTMAGDEQTSGREDSIHPQGWYGGFWRSRSARLVATTPWRRPGRWGSPTEPAQQQAKCGESQPASRQRSRSARWQTREILCPFHLDCAQKRESP